MFFEHCVKKCGQMTRKLSTTFFCETLYLEYRKRIINGGIDDGSTIDRKQIK